MSDDALQRDKEQLRLEALAANRAAATPLPGALADVFAPRQDIEVGPYKIRPFYDVDFETMQLIEHPLAGVALGDTKDAEEWRPRGPMAWQLFWVMTHSPEEVDALLASGGKDALAAKAKAEFSRQSLGALLALYHAVVRQLSIYAQAVVGYAAADDPTAKDDDKGKAKTSPPD